MSIVQVSSGVFVNIDKITFLQVTGKFTYNIYFDNGTVIDFSIPEEDIDATGFIKNDLLPLLNGKKQTSN